MKELEMKLLYELMKNSRRSDRSLAKVLGVGQPTVSRMVKKLQKDLGVMFTASADLGKVGFEIIAITFGRKGEKQLEEQMISEFLGEFNNSIIFASTGRSSDIDADRMVISMHRSYSDYVEFKRYLQTRWSGTISVKGSFIISLGTDRTIRPLSTHYLFEEPRKHAMKRSA